MKEARFVARRPKLALDDFFPYLINRLGVILVAGFLADALEPNHLSIAMWRVLVALSDQGTRRQVDLGDMTSIDASTLSRMVTRLAKMGLVTRARSETSDREVEIKLTAKGGALLDKLVPLAIRHECGATAGISKTDLATAKGVLRRMHANLTET